MTFHKFGSVAAGFALSLASVACSHAQNASVDSVSKKPSVPTLAAPATQTLVCKAADRSGFTYRALLVIDNASPAKLLQYKVSSFENSTDTLSFDKTLPSETVMASGKGIDAVALKGNVAPANKDMYKYDLDIEKSPTSNLQQALIYVNKDVASEFANHIFSRVVLVVRGSDGSDSTVLGCGVQK